MTTPKSEEQQVTTWDTLIVNEQLYHHLFHQQQSPQQRPQPPLMQHHHHQHQHQQSMIMDQKEMCASSSIMVTQQQVASENGMVPLPTTHHTPPHTPASDSWLMDSKDQALRRCGGLSGDFTGYATTTHTSPGMMVASTPSPTRSQCLFDDHDYQKLRQPPRSTPMIRKNFVQHSPMRPNKRSTMAQRKSSTYTRWTTEEDELLRQAVALHGPHKWSLIASHVPNRTPMQCSTRWLGALNPNIHKGRWTEHEDAVLKYSFLEFSGIPDGEGGFQPIPWNKIAERIPNRTGIQCQARWTEALDRSVRKGKWSEDEDVLLRAGVDKFGRCWIRIAETVPGRTQRQCRTRWMQIKYKEEKLSSGLTTTISSSNNDKKSLSSTSPKQLQQEPNGHHGGDVTATTMTTTTVSSDDAGSSGASCTSTEPDSLDFMVSDQVPISGLVAPADLFSPTQQQHTSSFDNFGLDCPSIRHPPSHHQQQQQQQHHHHHHHHHHQTNDLSAAVFAAHQQEQQHSNLDLLSDDTLLSPFFFY